MKGWKTITFNVLALVLVVLNAPEFLNLWPGGEQIIAIAVTVINFILRFITDGPVFNRPKTG